MPRFQIVIDCADPDRMARFWATALGYEIEQPPAGFDSWQAYWRSVGVPEDELGDHDVDSVVDPDGAGPRIWFQQVPEAKVGKNRLHFDIAASGGRTVPIEIRRQRVQAAADRLTAAGATQIRELAQEGLDHYAIAMHDPEGNEFDIN